MKSGSTWSALIGIAVVVLACAPDGESGPTRTGNTPVTSTVTVLDNPPVSMEVPTPTLGPSEETDAPTNPACDFVPAPETGPLRLCTSGGRVAQLQQALVDLGYAVGGSGVDQRFGPATELAVRRFQCDFGLVVDGIAGPATLAALDEAMRTLGDPSATTTILSRSCG